jgi:hypothetical protein
MMYDHVLRHEMVVTPIIILRWNTKCALTCVSLAEGDVHVLFQGLAGEFVGHKNCYATHGLWKMLCKHVNMEV